LLAGKGYTPGTVRNALKEVGYLGRWMASTDLEVSKLNEGSLGAFLGARRADGTRRVPSRRSLEPLLTYLRDEGVPKLGGPPSTPVGELAASYRSTCTSTRTA
jgi:hypothetical protein